ncbi:MAG: MobA/MobL family protein [Ruminococcus sp.]|nr:MobA/MobL family protein [Ruminococcus sp.]
MAIYHMSIKIGSKGKGQSAVAAAAYRSGDKLTDKQTGLTSDYTRKGGVVHSEISLCDDAPLEYADRETLWNAVHEIENKKNSRLWREFEVALPKEFTREDQIETVRDFVTQLTGSGMCADWSLHDKGDGNPHAHIMATVRSITNEGKWAPKSRLVYDLDENGERIFQKLNKQGYKQYKSHKEDYNNWNAAERVEEWRSAWAKCCNDRLAENEQIDHRSYERQGIDQIPTIHEGYAARKIAAAGGTSERVEINNEIRQKNSLLQKIASQLKTIGEEIKKLLLEQSLEKGSAVIGKLLQRSRSTRADERVRAEHRGQGEAASRERGPMGETSASGADEQQTETGRIGETTTTEIVAGAKQVDEAAMRIIGQRNAEKVKREAERARKAALEREREERAAKEAASRSSGFSRGR